MSFNDILGKVNDVMYTYILIVLLVGVGIYFTVRAKGVQFRLLKDFSPTICPRHWSIILRTTAIRFGRW